MQPLTVTTPSGRVLTLICAIPSDEQDEDGFPISVRHTFAVNADDESVPLSPVSLSVDTRLADRCGTNVWEFLQAEAVRRLEAALDMRMPIELEADEPD